MDNYNYYFYNANPNYRNTKEIEQNSKKNLEIKKEKAVENIYSNNIIKNEAGNNIGEVNLNYVNNFCGIY